MRNRREFFKQYPAQPFVYVKTRHIRGEEKCSYVVRTLTI